MAMLSLIDFSYLHFMNFLNTFMFKTYFKCLAIRKQYLTVHSFNYNHINIIFTKGKLCAILEACEGNMATSC